MSRLHHDGPVLRNHMLPDEVFAEQQRFWNGVLQGIEAKVDVIASQLEQAGEQFPDLVASFNLMLALPTPALESEGTVTEIEDISTYGQGVTFP